MIDRLARYILSHDGAEFALAVTGDWCQGIGRLLLERLERRAAAEGVNRRYAEVLPANAPMLRLVKKAGFALVYGRINGVRRIEKTLTCRKRALRTDYGGVARPRTPAEV